MQFWRYKNLLVLVGFLVLGLMIYAPVMRGPFQFDDKRVILDPAVRERRDLWGFVRASWEVADDLGGPLGTRSLVHASFLANWLIHGEETEGYHVVNVLIHIAASYLVFVMVRQVLGFTGRASSTSRPGRTRAFWLAVFGGGVFLTHPVQTQAVAYISQRFVSMAALFYLASVTLYLKARRWTMDNGQWTIQERRKFSIFNSQFSIPRQSLWLYVGSWVAAFVAMSSKEIAATLPVMLVILEMTVVRKRLKLKEWLVLGTFFLIAIKIPIQVVFYGPPVAEGASFEEVAGRVAAVEERDLAMTPWTYLLTQFNVVRTYIRLLVVPIGQSLDYDYSLTTGFWELPTPLSLAFLLAVLGLGLWAFRQGSARRVDKQNKRGQKNEWVLVSLGILWFFVTLLPSSSIIPIRDVIYEHRLYLSVVGFVLLLIFLIHKFYDRYSQTVVTGAVLLLVIYSGLTIARNTVWASELKLWEDAWIKGPEKARTNKNYGFVLTQEGQLHKGIERLERAIELKPDDQNYYITLGAAYLQVQEWEKARKAFVLATELRPDKADGWNNLGVALFQQKRYRESREAFEEALEKDSEFYMAWLGVGGAELFLGNVESGERAFERAIELEPADPRSYSNLVSLYVKSGQWQKAWETIGRLEAVDPSDVGLAGKKRLILEQLKK